jgi:hypothetical protein
MTRTNIESTDETNYIFCDNCGQIIPYSTWAKRKKRAKANWRECLDCTSKPVRAIIWNHPVLGKLYCHPYDGELNELWQPINAVGDLYRPGERICGYKDCVNSNHIKPFEKKTISDQDLFWGLVEAQAINKKVDA